MKLLKKLLFVLTGVLFAAGFSLFYAFRIEPYLLVTKKYTIGETTEESLRIVQLSDLELSRSYPAEQLDKIVERVNALYPDIVVFTGDLFQNYAQYRSVDEVVSALEQITAVYGKYAVWGNNDYGGGAVRQYRQIMEQSGFQLLENTGINIKLSDGKTIFIGGLDDGLLGNPDIDKALENLDESSSYRVLLLHEPDLADNILDYGMDLILAGHSHGGQINIAFLRDLFGIDLKYRTGFYPLENLPDTVLYVNSGIGTSRIPVRFLVPPQIASFKINL